MAEGKERGNKYRIVVVLVFSLGGRKTMVDAYDKFGNWAAHHRQHRRPSRRELAEGDCCRTLPFIPRVPVLGKCEKHRQL